MLFLNFRGESFSLDLTNPETWPRFFLTHPMGPSALDPITRVFQEALCREFGDCVDDLSRIVKYFRNIAEVTLYFPDRELGLKHLLCRLKPDIERARAITHHFVMTQLSPRSRWLDSPRRKAPVVSLSEIEESPHTLLYHNLCHRGSPRGIRVPSTLVYKNNFVKGWFSGDNIKRMVGQDVDSEVVFREMVEGSPKGRPVAVFLEVGRSDCHLVIHHLDKEMLHDFLQLGKQPVGTSINALNKNGVLQRYVKPAVTTETTEMVEVDWTPYFCVIEKKRGVNKVAVRLSAGAIEAVQQDVESIVKILSTGEQKILRLILYFKFDAQHHLWLLFCHYIRYSTSPPSLPTEFRLSPVRKSNLSPTFLLTLPPPRQVTPSPLIRSRLAPKMSWLHASTVRPRVHGVSLHHPTTQVPPLPELSMLRHPYKPHSPKSSLKISEIVNVYGNQITGATETVLHTIRDCEDTKLTLCIAGVLDSLDTISYAVSCFYLEHRPPGTLLFVSYPNPPPYPNFDAVTQALLAHLEGGSFFSEGKASSEEEIQGQHHLAGFDTPGGWWFKTRFPVKSLALERFKLVTLRNVYGKILSESNEPCHKLAHPSISPASKDSSKLHAPHG